LVLPLVIAWLGVHSIAFGESHIIQQLGPALVGVIGGREVAQPFAPSVVKVLTDSKDNNCSGLLLGNCVVTAKHCAERDTEIPNIRIAVDGIKDPLPVERALRHVTSDVAVMKLKIPARTHSTSRNVLAKATPSPGTRTAYAGFGDQTYLDDTPGTQRSKQLGHGIVTGTGDQDGRPVIWGGGLAAFTGSGDSGTPIVALDEEGHPSVIGIVEGKSKDYDREYYGKMTASYSDIKGSFRMRWAAIGPIRPWLDEALDKLGCEDQNGTLVAKDAFAKMFEEDKHGFEKIDLSKEESAQFRGLVRKEITIDSGKVTAVSGYHLVKWMEKKLGYDPTINAIHLWTPETWGDGSLYLNFSPAPHLDLPMATVVVEGDQISLFTPSKKKR